MTKANKALKKQMEKMEETFYGFGLPKKTAKKTSSKTKSTAKKKGKPLKQKIKTTVEFKPGKGKWKGQTIQHTTKEVIPSKKKKVAKGKVARPKMPKRITKRK